MQPFIEFQGLCFSGSCVNSMEAPAGTRSRVPLARISGRAPALADVMPPHAGLFLHADLSQDYDGALREM